MSTGQEVIVSIRLIRSFEHRNLRFLVLRGVNLEWTTEEFMEKIRAEISTSSLPPPFKKFDYDCLKIEHQAHGAKTNDPVISCDNDDSLILKPNQKIDDRGVKHETAVSFFRLDDYKAYVATKVD